MPALTIEDADFGVLEYDDFPENNGFWNSIKKWQVPKTQTDIYIRLHGNKNGPFEVSREFILNKSSNLEVLWELGNKELKEFAKDWYQLKYCENPEEYFIISGISMMPDNEWQISFDTKAEYRLVNLDLVFNKENIYVGNYIST